MIVLGVECWCCGWFIEVLGVFYVLFSVGLLVVMWVEVFYGLEVVILLFVIVWVVDSFVYLVGIWLGGFKFLL